MDLTTTALGALLDSFTALIIRLSGSGNSVTIVITVEINYRGILTVKVGTTILSPDY